MSRISIDVTAQEHQRLKAMAALQGKSIKEYVIERTLGMGEDADEASALKELEALLDRRIRSAQSGAVSERSVGDIFKNAYRERKGK
ncbi:MAG: antitoxin [Verrucomicrobia bacterium]|nr:antitoxin [Verrucomicrobiota bacterium]